MGLQAQLSATLTTGPSSLTDQQFPSGVTSISFGLNPPTKPYTVSTGAVVTIQSPSSPVSVDSIGTGGQVTQATTFYARTSAQMLVTLVCADPGGGADHTSVIPINGLMGPIEFPSNGYLKSLSVQGSGTFEYWAAGNL